jgi:hypothetical protein
MVRVVLVARAGTECRAPTEERAEAKFRRTIARLPSITGTSGSYLGHRQECLCYWKQRQTKDNVVTGYAKHE